MQQQQNAPNLFVLRNQSINITYSTSSISGQPQFSYRDQQQEHTFQGEQIRSEETAIGTLVTVTLEQVPDLHTITLTLLLPTIQLRDTKESFRTRAIRTTHRTSIGGPQLVSGAIQTYEVMALRGTAQAVDF